jgi:CelD/BcsL family acetyltransferase involved in cellulose biosynthesis
LAIHAPLREPSVTSPTPGFVAPRVRLAPLAWREMESPEQIARWDALAQWAAEPNPFHESWYVLPALRAFDTPRKVALLCLEADGQLAGILPVRRESRYYGHPLPHWSGWLHANAFVGTPLVARGFETIFWRELLSWCDANAKGALFLHLAQLPSDGSLHEALRHVLAEQRRPAATVMLEERAMLHSDLSAEDYLEQSLSGKKRKELRRQHRRLAEEGELASERLTGPDGLAGWTEEFLLLERRGWKGAAGSALACDPRTKELFRKALAGAARRGRLERLAIRLDGRPLAMLANFLCPPGAFSFKTAFDEDFARFSPGVLLQRENLEMLARPGIAWADSCAAAEHPMIDHFWRERRTIARHNIAIGGTVRRAAFRLIARRETGKPAGGIA